MKTVEVENKEIAIRNSKGDIVIIPKEKATTVKVMIEKGMHGAVDTIVNSLPVLGDKAQDGGVIGMRNRSAQTDEFPLPDAVKNSDKVLKIPLAMSAFDSKQMEQERLSNIEQPPKEKEYSRDPNEEQFYFTDRRTTHPVTNAQMNPNRDLKSDFYSTSLVREIARQSEQNNIDPNLALAIAMQETSIGKTDGNFGHTKPFIQPLVDKDYDSKVVSQMINSIKKSQGWGEDYFKKTHKMTDEQFNSYDIDTWRLQSYNGLGVLTANTEKEYLEATGRNANHFYGIDVTKQPLDLKNNPAYAKTVISLREQISKDPDFQRIINENKTPEQKLISHLNKK